jgi:undecaprenyl-diphosphatase
MNKIYKVLADIRKKLKVSKVHNQLFIVYLVMIFSLSWLVIFLTFMEDSLESGGGTIDTQVIHYVLSVRNPEMNSFFEIFTSLGNLIPILIISSMIISILFYYNKKGESLFFGINVLGVWIINELLKQIFRRKRPQGIQLITAVDFSFPSGHAMVTMASVLLLIYFVVKFIKNKKLAYLFSVILFIYALLIGISRIYLGVHYFSDVIVGWIIAGVYAFINIQIYIHMLSALNFEMKVR